MRCAPEQTFDDWIEPVRKPFKARTVEGQAMKDVHSQVIPANHTANSETKGGSTQKSGRPHPDNCFCVNRFEPETGKTWAS
ncbi:hypothetical protein Rhopal_001172-T1 [Rhodotorula paludigena]|uniref:Uncharacterized protein n=1 Tax=Rhodotorula paludigena TaxID=86838 RepID=A0AAV5GGM8_9BASI|nr:hypothetical protein Rhopal_001172-T1 [Rhodotorula paludigena]